MRVLARCGDLRHCAGDPMSAGEVGFLLGALVGMVLTLAVIAAYFDR